MADPSLAVGPQPLHVAALLAISVHWLLAHQIQTQPAWQIAGSLKKMQIMDS